VMKYLFIFIAIQAVSMTVGCLIDVNTKNVPAVIYWFIGSAFSMVATLFLIKAF